MAGPAPTSSAHSWEVTGQQETSDIGPQGTYVPGVRVSFRLASGETGSVFIPSDGYNVESVRGAITARAAHMAAVHDLTSDS